MKRFIAILIFLCIFSMSAAFSEETSIVSDGTPLALDGFMLNMTPGSSYDLYEKKENDLYVTVYPQEIPDGNYDIIPFRSEMEEYHNTIKRQIVEAGYSFYGFHTDDIMATDLAGEPCFIQNVEMILYIAEQGRDQLYQAYARLIYFRDKGYLFVANGSVLETTEALMIELDSLLTWN